MPPSLVQAGVGQHETGNISRVIKCGKGRRPPDPRNPKDLKKMNSK